MALLRNIADLKPVLYYETMWSGKYLMLRIFFNLFDFLITVADSSNCDIYLVRDVSFKQRVEKYVASLEQLLMLLRSCKNPATLSECR